MMRSLVPVDTRLSSVELVGKRQLDLLPHLRVVRVPEAERLGLPLTAGLQRVVLQE